MKVVDRPAVVHADGDQLLGQDVERVARDAGLLDLPGQHPLDHDGRLDQVAAVLREDLADAALANGVAGATDALHARGDRRRCLDLDHQVDGAHVDPQLEARRGDQRRQLALLELLLDLESLLPGDGAVMGADQLLLRKLVQPRRQPLGQAPGVHEDQGGPMRPDQLQQPRMDGGPDGVPRLGAGGRTAGRLVDVHDVSHARHVVDRHDDLEVQLLACAGVHHLDLAPDPAEEPGDCRQRSLGGGQADALRIGGGEMGQPLETQREVCAALGGGDGVDLVDDDVLDAAQDLARLAGEHEVERLGGRDEDVGGRLGQLATRVRRRVAGSGGDRDLGHLYPELRRGAPDPRQRRSEVALDVIRERLERADVEHAHRPGPRPRLGHQPVEAPQERCQGLARARRRVDQGVAASADGGPAEPLGTCGCCERLRKPGAGGVAERGEGIGGRWSGHGVVQSIGLRWLHPFMSGHGVNPVGTAKDPAEWPGPSPGSGCWLRR